METNHPHAQSLWRIYRRSQPAVPWRDGGNLPWDDPAFSERMLREHLDQSHGAASRQQMEIERQVDWLWDRLNLQPGSRLLDVTCGPGLYAVALAARGVRVTGIDFSPASLRYARELANAQGVGELCEFVRADVRQVLPKQVGAGFDAALFIYGQLAVFPRDESSQLLRWIAGALRAGGRLVVELLDCERIDRQNSSWWFTDDAGLWGESPFLCLGERSWDANQRAAVDRFFVLDLQTGHLDEYGVSDTAYETTEMLALLRDSDFRQATAYPAWDGLDLYDAEEWVLYLAER